ncbi:MAG TPA: imelysin family protein [Kofleriaceae bacterium]|nr:imelysin family protein [Kofleriaceae bacterium]
MAACALLALATCAPVPLGEGARRTTMRALTDQVVVPALDEAVLRAGAMADAARALADAPSQVALDAAQETWRTARRSWKETEAFAFGPATTDRLAASIDQASVDLAKIELELAGTAELTDLYVDNLGANRKGFHAVEYLLFRGGGDDDAAVLAQLTTDPGAARRREMAAVLARGVARDAGRLQRAWAPPDGGGYAETLTSPGAANPTYPTIKSVIDAFINQSVFLAELLSDTRLAGPLGLASGGAPRPELEESGPSDNSLADLAAAVRGMRNVYTGSLDGAPGDGIGTLVAARGPATDRELREAFATALAAIDAVPRPFRTAVAEHRAEVQAAYDAVKELKRILGTEVISLLGATLKFNNNDGD